MTHMVTMGQPYIPRRLRHDRDSLAAALPDILAARLGCAPSADDHPLAGALLDEDVGLRDLVVNTDPELRMMLTQPELEQTLLARSRALHTTSDFQRALVNAVQRLIVERYSASAEYHRLVRTIELANFKPVDFPALSLRMSEDDDVPTSEGAEATHRVDVVALRAGLSASVRSYMRLFGITRRLVINDQLDVVGAALSEFGIFAARREARAVFGVLTGNPTLADGRELFNATDKNVVADALGEASLGAAVAKLRRQTTIGGGETGHAPRFLLVAPEQEVAAWKLVASLTAGNAAAPLEVMSDPLIPNGTWFVLADPAIAPVVGFLKLRGAPTTRIDLRSPGYFDGLVQAFLHDFGVVPLGRVGAVKGEAQA